MRVSCHTASHESTMSHSVSCRVLYLAEFHGTSSCSKLQGPFGSCQHRVHIKLMRFATNNSLQETGWDRGRGNCFSPSLSPAEYQTVSLGRDQQPFDLEDGNYNREDSARDGMGETIWERFVSCRVSYHTASLPHWLDMGCVKIFFTSWVLRLHKIRRCLRQLE